MSRAAGRSSTAAAAYRSGTRIVDERTGEIHDYTRKSGVVDSVVILPDGGTMERAELWNKVEAHHKRGDALVAREFVLAIPTELSESDRRELVRYYAQELATKYRVAVDVCIHRPSKDGDDRNHHAHILMSACYVDSDGKLGKKCVELDPIHCARAGLPNAVEVERVKWQDAANLALQKSGESARIDHRSLAAQGITDRAPSVHLGPEASAIERRGEESQITERERAKVAEVLAAAQAAAVIERAQQKNIQELEGELAELRADRDADLTPVERLKNRIVEYTAEHMAQPLARLKNAQTARKTAQRAELVEAADKKTTNSSAQLKKFNTQISRLSGELDGLPWWRLLKKNKIQAELDQARDQATRHAEIIKLHEPMAKLPILEKVEKVEREVQAELHQVQPGLDDLRAQLLQAMNEAEDLEKRAEVAQALKLEEIAAARARERDQQHQAWANEYRASPAYKAEQTKARRDRERAESRSNDGPSGPRR